MAKRIETIVKELLDSIHRKNVPTRNGGEIEKGYKPDRVYEISGKILIVEIETSTDRKKHLGNYLKAHEYLERNNNNGDILMIIKERSNTKLESITEQVSKYYQWVTDLGASAIPVQIITIAQLEKAVKMNTGLFTEAFKKIGNQL